MSSSRGNAADDFGSGIMCCVSTAAAHASSHL